MRKASLVGGAPINLAQDLDGADLCDWADDGNVYFGSNAGIMRVPASGGRAELVAATSAERGEGSLEAPQLLPGGKLLLLNVTGTPGVVNVRVDVLELTTGRRKAVLEGVGVSTFVPARGDGQRGYLVYGLSGTVFAVPFDLERFEAGTPQPI